MKPVKHKTIAVAAVGLTVLTAVAAPRRLAYPSAFDATAILSQGICTRGGDEAVVSAMVEFEQDCDIRTVLAEYGVIPGTVTSGCATARIPVSRLAELAGTPGIVKISACEVHLMSDRATALTRVDDVHAGLYPLLSPYFGDGVIVGVIDSGFDYLHPAFSDSDGNSRISVVWDQTYPAVNVGTPSEYGYGILLTDPDDVKRVAHDFSGDTHGTHVAAVAASSADVYTGVAPGAELALVSTDRSEAGIADALSFLIGYADEREKPIAINISMGTVLGFKDGSDRLAAMIDDILQDTTGKLVAIAAGNEGDRKSTITGDGETQVSTRLILPSYNRENIFAGCSGGTFSLTMNLRDSSGAVRFSASLTSDSPESVRYDNLLEDGDGSYLVLSPTTRADGAASVSATLYSALTDGDYWELTLSDLTGRYILSADYGELAGGSEQGTIACTACGYEPVAVGAYVSRSSFTNLQGDVRDAGRVEGEDYPLSGKGPTFDGRKKPDVMAPGDFVISAINSYASPFSVNTADLVLSRKSDVINNRTDYWGAMSGTSMATPVVTGIMALWLQANPDLTSEDVHSLMAEMRNIEAFNAMTSLTSGVDIPFEGDSPIEVFDMRGLLMMRTLENLNPGIYIIKRGEMRYKYIVR